MQTLTTIAEIRQQVTQAKQQGLVVAFVPTMGNLHTGHIQLVKQAVKRADVVIASIFVNPLQFSANEDLDKYPRTLAEDQAKLTAAGCKILFAPNELEMYPQGRDFQTEVEVPKISDLHCGSSRPGHFQGVATVVCKLFGIVQPDVAIFGAKDFQQLLVIRRMTQDLCLPVEIESSPIARAPNGLALSSRNGYLSDEELAIAPALYKALTVAQANIQAGRYDYAQLSEEAQVSLEKEGFKRDYFNICNPNTLLPATEEDTELVILAAAYLGKARLIDNITISL